MNNAQHTLTCKILLHPTASSNRAAVATLQKRTGLTVVITRCGLAKAVPTQKGAA